MATERGTANVSWTRSVSTPPPLPIKQSGVHAVQRGIGAVLTGGGAVLGHGSSLVHAIGLPLTKMFLTALAIGVWSLARAAELTLGAILALEAGMGGSRKQLAAELRPWAKLPAGDDVKQLTDGEG